MHFSMYFPFLVSVRVDGQPVKVQLCDTAGQVGESVFCVD